MLIKEIKDEIIKRCEEFNDRYYLYRKYYSIFILNNRLKYNN